MPLNGVYHGSAPLIGQYPVLVYCIAYDNSFAFLIPSKLASSGCVIRTYVGSLQNQFFFLRILEKMVQSL